MRIPIVSVLVSMALIFQPAFALDILNPGKGQYLLSGEIQSGDAEKLAKTISEDAALPTGLLLNSPGGDIAEALRITLLTKVLRLSTKVDGGGICASACFFIYLAGDYHIATWITPDRRMPIGSLGYIGLHRPYLKSDPSKIGNSIESEAKQHEIMQKTRAYLSEQDVPQRIIDIMMSRPSNDIYWLTEADIKQLGDYSPSREEYLISHCGYNRHLLDDLYRESRNIDITIATHGREQMNAFAVCSTPPDLFDEIKTNKERLRNGWRPWLKVAVTNKKKAS